METLIGIALVTLAGLGTGTMIWPLKAVRRFKFEQVFFVAMLLGLIVIPWIVVLASVPNLFQAYASVDKKVLLKSNLFAMSWGVANVLFGLCVVRIGAALTGAILTGVGLIVGVSLPMLIKGTGLFSDAPSLASPAGLTVLAGVIVMVAGVALVSVAGFGRERSQRKGAEPNPTAAGGFLGGMIMSALAGILSAGISFSFVYSQGPIVQAMKAQGADDIPANISVWAIGLLGGALVNVLYPAYLMTRNRSWAELFSFRDAFVSSFFGIQFILAMVLLGRGMLWLGILGASVGWGIQQATQILGTQGVGFISGEWRGVARKPLAQMIAGILVLIVAAVIMACGNTLAKR